MISRPLSLYSLCHSRKCGKVATHGPHQTAQKSSRTTFPLRSDSLVGFPFKENSPLKSGAALPRSALNGSDCSLLSSALSVFVSFALSFLVLSAHAGSAMH